jgi:hypothetical protein
VDAPHRANHVPVRAPPRQGDCRQYAGTAALALVICPFAVASTLGVAALTAGPDIAGKIDPVHAMMSLATSQHMATSAAVLTGWVVLTTAAGAVVTHRKALA